MLAQLSQGKLTIGELAAPRQMSFAGALRETSDWLSQWEQFWSDRLAALEAAIKADREP